MNKVIEYLQKEFGYNDLSSDYYNTIQQWINEWKGSAEWLNVKTIDGKAYPMYSLGMAKRSCEDLASIITSEPFTIKATKSDKVLQEDIEKVKLLEKLPDAIEKMAYTGTVGTVIRIKNAEVVGEDENAYLRKTAKTKKEIINIKANQILPLTWENGELVDVAFASDLIKIIDGKQKKIIYIEIHELKERGYQISNIYLDAEDGKPIVMEGVIPTYNTLSQVPMFAINKMPKSNIYDNNMGLGMALFGDSQDQLQMLDLVYNNFGQDFKLGQKIMVINKKLTRIEQEEYTDKDGNLKIKNKVLYPSDLQKQQFMEISDGLMGDGTNTPYIYEYNPDLRVGDNKEGIQFALDNFAFKIGFGTHYYSFENGGLTTATEAVLSRQDFVVNGNKIRKQTNEYLKAICKALLLSEKILGNASIDETQEIDIAEVDGFLEDENTIREKIREDVNSGFISKKRYLMKVYNMTEEEALAELQEIDKEDNIGSLDIIDEDKSE